MENELLLLFKYGVATGAWTESRVEPGLSARATDFVHNTDWLGEGGSFLPWHLRPHPGLEAQDRSSDSQRRAAPLQSRVTANSARKKRTALGRRWFRQETRSTYLCGFYHKLEGAELTWMKQCAPVSLGA